jgi:hypothetical protein
MPHDDGHVMMRKSPDETSGFGYLFTGAVKMADPIGELNAVLAMCGIVDEATWANIINQEGFTQLSDLGVLETDSDVTEMAKRMAA